MSRELEVAIEQFAIGRLAETPTPVSQAYSNEVWRVRTDAGSFALKLFPPRLPEERRRQLSAGIVFEQLVLRLGQILMPHPVCASDSWLVELPTPAGPRLARCHAWVPGDPATQRITLGAIIDAGRYLGILHALQQPGGDTSQLPSVDLDRWQSAVRSARSAGLGWADRLAALSPIVDELAVDLEELRSQRRPMQLSHRDFDPKNAILNTGGRLVLTDWDYAGPVLPGVELIVGATSFARTDDELARFVRAYREAGGTAIETDPLAMTAEIADLDWLLRDVEACLAGELEDHYTVAETLISALPDEIAAARSWPHRLQGMLGR